MRTDILLNRRNELYREWHRYAGMPTLAYDEILEAIGKRIIAVEKELTVLKVPFPINEETFGMLDP